MVASSFPKTRASLVMETPASRKYHKTSFNLFPKYTRSRKNDQHGQFRLT